MVATVDEMLQIVRSNPFIDGIGYFIEVTTAEPASPAFVKELTKVMHDGFCQHAQVSIEGEDVIGLDFHEHIFTQGDDSDRDLSALEKVLKMIEAKAGIDHLCIELQFDMGRAREAKKELDQLLRP